MFSSTIVTPAEKTSAFGVVRRSEVSGRELVPRCGKLGRGKYGLTFGVLASSSSCISGARYSGVPAPDIIALVIDCDSCFASPKSASSTFSSRAASTTARMLAGLTSRWIIGTAARYSSAAKRPASATACVSSGR